MSDLPSPGSRTEFYLAGIAGESVPLPEKPISRIEHYLAVLAGQDVTLPERAISRIEHYLAYLVEHPDDIDVEELRVVLNGTYTAPEGTAYSPVTVNVPPTPITQVGSTLYIGTEETNDG